MRTSTDGPHDVLASEILRLVPCDRIAFAVPLSDGSGYRIAGVHPIAPPFPDFPIPPHGSCTAHVAAARHGKLLSAIGEEARYAEEEPLYRAGIHDAAFVPLFLGGELVAVAIVGRTEVHSLEPRSVRCLEKVSGLLAALYAASRDSESATSRPSGGVGHFAHRIAQEGDLDRACRAFLEAVRDHGPWRRAILTLLDADLKAYQWFFAGLSEAEMDQFHRQPVPDEKCRELFRDPGRALRREDGKTFLLLTGPQERPLGFLMLPDAGDGASVAESDPASLEVLADILSSAIDRFHLAAELKRERNRLQKSQEQLVHSERLSAIGQLVSGVAHELNNPLAGVVGFAELVTRNNTNPKCARDLQRIISEAQRCQHIVQNLLNFARRTKAERRPMDINELVENVLDLRSYQLRLDNIQIQKDLAADLPKTAGDHHQIQQVFLNVVNNAQQAMQEGGSQRTLRISTRAEADRILIRFEDTGPGIPQARLSRVFEPFFTTKAAGKGTGLGLSLSQGIVKEHGGQIRVESTLDKGTTFTVELPVLASEEETAADPTGPARKPESAPHSVLVVDDEEVIVELLNEVLITARRSFSATPTTCTFSPATS